MSRIARCNRMQLACLQLEASCLQVSFRIVLGSVLLIVGAFLLTIGACLLTIGVFLLSAGACLLTMRRCVHLDRLQAEKLNGTIASFIPNRFVVYLRMQMRNANAPLNSLEFCVGNCVTSLEFLHVMALPGLMKFLTCCMHPFLHWIPRRSSMFGRGRTVFPGKQAFFEEATLYSLENKNVSKRRAHRHRENPNHNLTWNLCNSSLGRPSDAKINSPQICSGNGTGL